MEVDAVQVIAGLFVGDGEPGAVDDALEVCRRQLEAVRQVAFACSPSQCSVRDTSEGVPPCITAKISEPFPAAVVTTAVAEKPDSSGTATR
jgi:hypothetical protein